MATRQKKTSKKKSARAPKSAAPAETPEESDDVLEGYDEQGRPIWGKSGDEEPFPGDDAPVDDDWPDDVPTVSADEIVGAEGEPAPPREYRMHPIVAEMVRANDRLVPMEDHDELRPRTEGFAVKLTSEERIELGDALTKKLDELEQVKADNARQRKAMKQAEETREAEIRKLAAFYRQGEALKQIPVQRIADIPRNVSLLVRLDTGEIVRGRDRTLTDAEREELLQVRLPLPGVD